MQVGAWGGPLSGRKARISCVEKGLLRCNKTRSWVLHNIKNNGFDGPHDLFCMEWTPHRGFYFVTYDGDVKRGREEIAAEKIENEVQM